MKQLYLIGNSHIDPVWLWRWQDGYSEVLATWRSALDRMKEFEDFQYTSACAVYYQWVEKTDPEMFAEITARIKEGRWNVTGGWFLQPDCNIPSGESFARHALIAQRYFKEKFGLTARSGYNVDSFGHNASLPKILRASGMDRYVFMRPSESEKALGFDLFSWKSDDGSAVTAFRIPESYAIRLESLSHLDSIAESIDRDGVSRMAFYGVGNHGGGPTSELIRAIIDKKLPNAVFATVDQYFDALPSTDLPVVSEELQHHARGCYSANASVKKANRQCEENILAAERICLFANKLINHPYPKKRLQKAWKNLLFNQFHDILAGCAIESAYTDASYLFGEIMSITEQAINEALQEVCRKIPTGDSFTSVKKQERKWVWEHDAYGTPLVIFNPHAFPVRTTVTMRIAASCITNEMGREIPFQLTRGEQTNHNGDVYVVTFPVDLPAYGYRVYRAFQQKTPTAAFQALIAEPHRLENDLIRVDFDEKSGEINRITDKKTGNVLPLHGMGAILTDETACDTWAHDRRDLGEVVGAFSDPEFSVLEAGSVCAKLRVRTHYGKSTLTRDYCLTAGSDEIRVDAEVDFWEEHKALKLTFPAKGTVRCEIPYGTVERRLSTGEEPFGRWFATNGLCVANTGIYAYDSTDSEIRMTVLRGAIYADHYGTRDSRCRFMDRGLHSFTYTLFAFRDNTDAHKRAALLNMPVRTVNESFHGGSLPQIYSGFACDFDHVIVTACKQSEDGDAAVIRLLECEGIQTDLKLMLMGKEIGTTISPYAIRTLHEDGTALNFMEWEENART